MDNNWLTDQVDAARIYVEKHEQGKAVLRIKASIDADFWNDPAVDRETFVQSSVRGHTRNLPGQWQILSREETQQADGRYELLFYITPIDVEYAFLEALHTLGISVQPLPTP